MMEQMGERVETSRRAMVAGGAVVAATLVAGWWTRGRVAGRPDTVTPDTVTVVPGAAAAPSAATPTAAAAALAALVGQAARIGGEFGPVAATIAEATPLPSGGPRPAGLRALAYQLTFVTDRAGAPRGEAIYPLAAAIDGMDRLFLSRGPDRGDRATLVAIVD